jgi:hypothetical protein
LFIYATKQPEENLMTCVLSIPVRAAFFSILLLPSSLMSQALPGQGQAPYWTNPTTIGSSPAVVYADAFPASIGDACQRINAAWNSLPSTGGVIDARGFNGTQSCSINPLNGVSVPGLLLLGEAIYSINTPWIIPSQVRVIGSSRGSATGGTGTSLQANSSAYPVYSTGTVGTNGANLTQIKGSGTGWTSSPPNILVGSLFFSQNGSVTVQSTISNIDTNNQILTLSVPASTTLPASSTYTITPAMVQFAPTQSGPISFGISIANLQISCGSLANGLAIQNWWAQELSYVQDINVSDCVGLALDVETSGAMNSGPYSNVAVGQPGGTGHPTPTAGTLCAELLSTGDLRGIHGITCTSNGTPKTGIDISTPATTLEDVHLEGYGIGVEIAAHPSASNRVNGLTVINVNGGTGSGAMTTLVDIFSDPNFQGSTEVNIFGLSVPPSSGVTNLLIDNIMGTTVATSTEISLSSYILGRVQNAGGNRLRLTSSPNAPNIIPTINGWPATGGLNGGSVTISGGVASGTGTAGNLTLISGPATSSGGTNGTLSLVQSYVKGSTYTVGNLGCLSATQTISDCSTNKSFIGINLAANGSAAQVQTFGDVTVNLDGGTPTVNMGDYICISSGTPGVSHGQGSACNTGEGVGISMQTKMSSPTSILIHLRSN